MMRTKRSIPHASTGLHQLFPTAPMWLTPRAQLRLGPQGLQAYWSDVSIHAFEHLAPHSSRTSWDTQYHFLHVLLPQGKEEMPLLSPPLC